MSEQTVLTHQPCPYEDCGSEDGFSWVPETQIGLCFSCCNTYPNKKKMVVGWARDVYPIREKL